MADETKTEAANENAANSRDEVALKLMQFIAVTTGFGGVLLSYWRGDFKTTSTVAAEV